MKTKLSLIALVSVALVATVQGSEQTPTCSSKCTTSGLDMARDYCEANLKRFQAKLHNCWIRQRNQQELINFMLKVNRITPKEADTMRRQAATLCDSTKLLVRNLGISCDNLDADAQSENQRDE